MTNSILTEEHEDTEWMQAMKVIEERFEDLLKTRLGETHPLYDEVAGLERLFVQLGRVYDEGRECAFDRGLAVGRENAEGREAALAIEQKAHETVAAVVAEWMPRIKLFCQRVEKHLGSWRPDESGDVHEIRKDLHEIPRGWV